jgi:putative transposase
MKANRGLSIKRMVELGGVSRSGYYRFDESAKPCPDPDMDLRDAIQRIALEGPCYGRPRIMEELRKRGWTVNPERVHRLLREDNLLCVRKRKFVVTTDSNHGRKIYPNLARAIALTTVNQLWRADITYIRLREEFVFLAVILDAYSRRVIGWAPARTLEDELTLVALRIVAASTPAPRRYSVTSIAIWPRPAPRSASLSRRYLHGPAEGTPDRHQHVAQRQSVGQRCLANHS